MTEAEIKELQEQNYMLQAENKELERRITNLQKRLASAEHEKIIAKSSEINSLRDQVCKYGQKLEKATKELKHVKKLLFERNRRYQEDCITINQLNTTVDVLVGRLARKM